MDPQAVVSKDDRPRPLGRGPNVDALEPNLGLRQPAEDVAPLWAHQLERRDGRVVRRLLQEDLGAVLGQPPCPGLSENRIKRFPPRLERVLQPGNKPRRRQLYPLLGVPGQPGPRRLFQEARVRPSVGELLQIGPRLEHAHGQRERHEIEAAQE